ncbi:MAG TPA: ATP-binding protein, partial [Polyangiales bacterium]
MRDAELGGTAEEGFVGRELEIDELSAELNRTLRGRPRCVLLRGDAGVGKTRLLREFSGIARRLGMQVVQGRAMEDSATPYLPFLNVIDTCAGEQDRSASSAS